MPTLNDFSNRNVLLESNSENDKNAFEFVKDSLRGILDEKATKEDLEKLGTKGIYSYFNSLHLNYGDEIMFVKIRDKENYLDFIKDFLLGKLLKNGVDLFQDREMLSYLLKNGIIKREEINLIINDFLDLHKNYFVEFFEKILEKSSFFNEELYVLSSLYSEKIIQKNLKIDINISKTQPESFVYNEINLENTQHLFNIKQKAINKIYEELLFNSNEGNNMFFGKINVYDTLIKILQTN